eukprot:scaffold140448_cov31-Tisochrysis_lutea.AAC.2
MVGSPSGIHINGEPSAARPNRPLAAPFLHSFPSPRCAIKGLHDPLVSEADQSRRSCHHCIGVRQLACRLSVEGLYSKRE